MTEDDAQLFVRSFEAAWAARDGNAMQALWRPEGKLFTPIVDRPVSPHELPKLVALQTQIAPDLSWHLVAWAARGDMVYVEWRVTQSIAGAVVEWTGMDRFVMKEGKILEERVYADTTPMRMIGKAGVDDRLSAASRDGISPTPMIRL
jgi:hypothetical protein